jgi:hypothetical protein
MSKKTTSWELVKFCLDNTIPDKKKVCDDYGFTNCKNETEYSYLLGLYSRLTRLPSFNTYDLHVYNSNKKTVEYITEIFDNYDSENFYYKWFKKNSKIVR